MRTPKKAGLFYVGFLMACSLCAQRPPYFHYTAADGLASSTVYQIVQDRQGFIWFATLNGMSRFDGKRFTTYRTADGLNSNSIITLAEGKQGEMYIGNYEKGINVFRNGRIEDYCSKIGDKSLAISFLLLDTLGKEGHTLYAYRSWGGINIIHEQKDLPLSTSKFDPQPILINRLALLHNGNLVALTNTGLYRFDHNSLSKIHVSGLPDTKLFCMANGNDSTYLLGTSGMIYQIKHNQVIRKISLPLDGNNDVCALMTDQHNNIWFSVMNRGFFMIREGSDEIIDIGRTLGLQQTLINNYLEDGEGNIWISTFGKGVYCLNNLYLKNYNEQDGLSNNNVYTIEKEKSGKWLIGTFNDINILENGTFNRINSLTSKTVTASIFSIQNINNDFYVCGTFGGSKQIQLSYQGTRFFLFNEPSFCKTERGLYLFGSYGNAITAQRALGSTQEVPACFLLFGDSTNINRVNAIVEDSEKNIWIATALGLCKARLDFDSSGRLGMTKSYFKDNVVLCNRINAVFQDNQQHIWFAGEKGIAKYWLENDSVVSFTTLDGYELSSSTTIVCDKQNRIWIGSLRGLYLLQGDSVRYLSSQTGLPSNEVLSLYYDSTAHALIIGTSNGISFLDIDLFDHYHPAPPSLTITGIHAGDSSFVSYEDLVFEPEQNNVSIQFMAINFSAPGSVMYKYKMNNEWAATEYNFLNFVGLKQGTYKLQILAKAQNTGWSKPYLLDFRILPRFTETLWFKLLVAGFLVAAALLILLLSLRMTKRKARKELLLTERINELKHQALSAMMNPHFIANSLNSVQYLVNSHQYEQANDYIAMMAKLMRKNLDTAGKGFIQLSEEISRLKLYLNIEKLRFQESFTYEINVGTDVKTDIIMIPNMIIQPFVENSLWHGIINSGKSGLLTVAFHFEDVDFNSVVCRSLIIKITDNGIGIKEAKKHKKDDHISKGIHIIEERLRLLSTKMHLPQPILFEDLSGPDKDTHGTEVIISLPPQLYKIHQT